MDKNEIQEIFIRNVKIALDAGAMYFYEHPTFLEKAELLKSTCERLLESEASIRLGFTTNSLYIGDKHFEGIHYYRELAHAFHIKKIKSLTIERGVTTEELKMLLSHVALPLEEIIKKGGLSHILQEHKVTRIAIDELKYAELLYGEGKECDDVWSYLLFEAVEKKDMHAINEYVAHFDTILDKCDMQELIVNDESRKNINRFLEFLRKTQKENYRRCAKQFLSTALKKNKRLQGLNVKELTPVIEDLEASDLADTLLEEILTDDQFNTFSFNIFAELTTQENQQDIASALAERMQQSKSRLHTPKVRKRLKELFSDDSSLQVPEVYRHFLMAAVKEIAPEGSIRYDRDHIHKNYQYILLDILSFEKTHRRLAAIIQILLRDWDSITSVNDAAYVQQLIPIINQRLQSDLPNDEALRELQKKSVRYFESLVRNNQFPMHAIDELIPHLNKDMLRITPYLGMIFNENQVTFSALFMILKVFPENIDDFLDLLNHRLSDNDFMRRIFDLLQKINTPESFKTLKHIYFSASLLLKQKVLQAMQRMAICDLDFLSPIIAKGVMLLRKEALLVAQEHPEARDKVAALLFSPSTFLGINRRLMRENIQLVDAVSFKEAKPYLVELSKKKFFWHRELRKMAQQVLRKWHD